MLKLHARFFAEDNLCPRARRDLLVTADEIGVQVRLDHILDPQSLRVSFRQILINIALRIDNHSFTLRPDQVRSMRKTGEIKLFEVHFVQSQSFTRFTRLDRIYMFILNNLVNPVKRLTEVCNIPERVSKGATSNTAGAFRPAKTYLPDASSPAIFYKPRATSACRQKYHPACHPAQPRAHAPPGASNAYPRSDPDAPEKSCSDVRRHLSTRSASYPDLQTHKARFLSHASSPTPCRPGPDALSPST